jgi:DNA-binding IclR family transcriptional regulator
LTKRDSVRFVRFAQIVVKSGDGKDCLSSSEVAKQLKIGKSTARELLRKCVVREWIAPRGKAKTTRYSLTPKGSQELERLKSK